MDVLSKVRSDSAAGHSASVEIWLYANGLKLPVLQSSENAIKVDQATIVPAGPAVLEVVVDGRAHRRNIEVVSASTNTGWLAIL